jgi:hypothetical protein
LPSELRSLVQVAGFPDEAARLLPLENYSIHVVPLRVCSGAPCAVALARISAR